MRLQFDVLDLLRTARGFQRPDGYAVMPDDLADKVEEELARLYVVYDAAEFFLNNENSGSHDVAVAGLRKAIHG